MKRFRGPLRVLGTAAALGLAVFVVWRAVDEFPRLDFSSPEVWYWLAKAIGLYMVSQVFGALAWREVLAAHGTILPPGRAESQLLLSQIGKYIPGNVAHLIGRYALGREDEIPGARIGSAVTMEVGLLLCIAALVSSGLLLAPSTFRAALVTAYGGATLMSANLLLPVLLIVALATVQAILWRRAGRPQIAVRHLFTAGLLHIANFAVLGVSLWCVAGAVLPNSDVNLLTTTVIFSVAWALGFIVPGAPGGIGIRDGVIALGLGLVMGDGAALAVAISHRVLSGLGDGAIFLFGLALRMTTKKPERSP